MKLSTRLLSSSGPGSVTPNYVEDVFSAYTRTGTGSSATVTTNLDASANKALVWSKSRSAATDHKLTDTVRGVTKALISDTTGAQTTDTTGLTAFSATGYTIGADSNYNTNTATYIDWEFVAKPKFFDIVTYTGNGSSITVNHSLASTPGCIIVKKTSVSGTASDWVVWHTSVPANCGFLNLTSSFGSAQRFSSVTSTNFTINVGTADVNENASTYVAYIFASNAGGFGLTGTDNVITCGSFTTDVSSQGQAVSLGWEPQFLMVKETGAADNWIMVDSSRGLTANPGTSPYLIANGSAAESSVAGGYIVRPSATGFQMQISASKTYIYLAIRRGPMRVPTDGTKVYNAIARTGTGAAATVTGVGFAPDLMLNLSRSNAYGMRGVVDRLRGGALLVNTDSNAFESDYSIGETVGFIQDGYKTSSHPIFSYSGETIIDEFFRRAPGFFDEVCWNGFGGLSNARVSHNLGVVPELIITKGRSFTVDWYTFHSSFTVSQYLYLNTDIGKATLANGWGTALPTSADFGIGESQRGIGSTSQTNVAYLFASCPGVSKVGSYTGNGTTQTINCGFTGGARFVLIKRTDSTGDWYTYDTVRGIVSANDPHLSLNTTAAEVTTDDSIDPASVGFIVNQVSATNVNITSANYIFLAIA